MNKMTRSLAGVAMGLIAGGFVLLPNPCRAAGAAARESSSVRALSSGKPEARQEALAQLRVDREAAIRSLMRIAARARGGEISEPNTEIHKAIVLLADLNATEACALLLEKIDYRVALPVGAKYLPGAEWPAAWALARMGPDSTRHAVDRIALEDNPVRRKLMTWVLYRSFTHEGAAAELERARQRWTGRHAERLRLQQAREDLARGNQLAVDATQSP